MKASSASGLWPKRMVWRAVAIRPRRIAEPSNPGECPAVQSPVAIPDSPLPRTFDMTLAFRLFASLVLLGAMLTVNAGTPARSAPPSFGPGADHIAATGQWFLNWEAGKKDISLSFRITRGHDHDSWGSQNVRLESLEGLSLDETGPVEFRVQRDAGAFFLRGSLADEKGAGT